MKRKVISRLGLEYPLCEPFTLRPSPHFSYPYIMVLIINGIGSYMGGGRERKLDCNRT